MALNAADNPAEEGPEKLLANLIVRYALKSTVADRPKSTVRRTGRILSAAWLKSGLASFSRRRLNRTK